MDDSKDWYPGALRVKSSGTPKTYRFLERTYKPDQMFVYAEFGIWRGDTAYHVCEKFPEAVLYLFDFEKNIQAAKDRLGGFKNTIHYFGNTQKYNDSYNWSLGKIMGERKGEPLFDYCFLDGAHTFAVDALNYFLCDRLLKQGGYMDFDDYVWRVRGSSLDPKFVPQMDLQYTAEQLDTRQVKMIVENLVRTDDRYTEIRKNKIFQKTRL